MSVIDFFVENQVQILAAFQESKTSNAAWKTLTDAMPEIQQVMQFPTFRQYGNLLVGLNNKLNNDGKLNKLNETITALNETIDGLNEKLNNEQAIITGLNNQIQNLNNELEKCRLNVSDAGLNVPDDVGLNNSDEKLNTDEPAKQKLNLCGWTVIKSGRYFRAFRKINKKVHGVHLGLTLDDAESKILAKQRQLKA